MSRPLIILALDLAKNISGFAILQIQDSIVEFVNWGRLKTDVRNDRNMFLVGQEIADFIRNTVTELRKSGSVVVCVEHPYFGGSRSAQQYQIFEYALQACYELSVNTYAPTPGKVKNFILSQFEKPQEFLQNHFARLRAEGKKIPEQKKGAKKYGLPLLKPGIREIYETVTVPANPFCPPSEHVSNDDALDGVYIALFAAFFCIAIPDLTPPYDTSEKKCLYWDSKAFYPDRILPVYENLTWRQQGLENILKVISKAKWYSHGSKECYLYNQIALAQEIHSHLKETDPSKALQIEKSWGKRTKRDDIGKLLVNYEGNPFMWTPMRILPENAQCSI